MKGGEREGGKGERERGGDRGLRERGEREAGRKGEICMAY